MDALDYRALASSPLFQGIGEEELQVLIEGKDCSIRRYHRDGIIAFRGDRYDELWILIDGRLRAEFHSHRGKVLKVESLKAHEVVASSVLFAEKPYFPVTLIAEEDSKICAISRNSVLKLLQKDERILRNYLRDTGDRLSLLAEKINMLQFTTIREKIAHYLLDEGQRQESDSPRLSYSMEVLSELFGVTRPALSREFSHLCEDGIIGREGHIVHFLDREALEEIIDSP